MSLLADRRERLSTFSSCRIRGRVREVVGLVIETTGLQAPVGALCRVLGPTGQTRCEAEVVGFRGDITLLQSLGDNRGIEHHDQVELVSREQTVPVGPALRGRVIDARGNPLDDKGPLSASTRGPLYRRPDPALQRPRIDEPLATGIRSIDGLVTCGRGQRVGIFAGSGVGKSVLMGMMARGTDADVIVIGLIGERGREVREFIDRDLGEEGLRRSVVVVATSDEPACLRVKGAFTATAIAEWYRDAGHDVLLLIDSVSRVAYAQREIGLSSGEPPATRGYPPSVFALMPQLLERSGRNARGSITGLYTVLVEGDDMNEPVSDAARSILDGHVALSRKLAHRGHYPAVSILESVSRVVNEVTDPEHQAWAMRLRELVAAREEAEDIINIGAYVAGSNPRIDEAVARWPRIEAFLRQPVGDKVPLADTVRQLAWIFEDPSEDEAAGETS